MEEKQPTSLTLSPRPLAGQVRVPSSKSQGHRLMMAAALAGGESQLRHLTPSQDILATRRCLEELGAVFCQAENGLTIHGIGADTAGQVLRMAYPRMDCGESGSTLRFLIPLVLALRGGGTFTGHGRLMERPLGPYFDLFREKGIFYEQKENRLFVQGELKPGNYALAGNVSSQFVTGLLFALPLLDGDSTLTLTTPLESASYVNMTLEVLNTFGITIQKREGGYQIPGGQRYRPAQAEVEGDWSQGAFWYAAMRLGNLIDVEGLQGTSTQGDRVIAQHLVQLCRKEDVTLDVSDCPDLVPPLAAMAAFRPGLETKLAGAARLRAKESDRLTAVREVLQALGGQVIEGADSLTIQGLDRLEGGQVDPRNDHRIAMMTAILATRCRTPVTILNPRCVEKSYPAFWEDYEKLGGKLQWNM